MQCPKGDLKMFDGMVGEIVKKRKADCSVKLDDGNTIKRPYSMLEKMTPTVKPLVAPAGTSTSAPKGESNETASKKKAATPMEELFGIPFAKLSKL